ncbi:unnamed protein product, partial [Adineta ricciae]
AEVQIVDSSRNIFVYFYKKASEVYWSYANKPDQRFLIAGNQSGYWDAPYRYHHRRGYFIHKGTNLWEEYQNDECFATFTRIDCSTSNPCGTYGYCVDTSGGGIECVCKFWWKGDFCDQQSSSGIQVIVLGVLSGILLIFFYALSIICGRQRRKEQPKKEKKKNPKLNSKLSDVAVVNVKRSFQLSSCLVFILMIIVATVALVIKWLLLQPIHNNLVQKYTNSELLYYHRISFCDVIDRDGYDLISLPVAGFFIIVFVIFSKRTSCLRQKLRSFIGPVIPMDFYIHVKRKLAAVIFAVIADDLLSIVIAVINGEGTQGEGVIVVYLMRIANILVIGIHYYPLLAGAYIDSILAWSCATLYAWLIFSLAIIEQGLCQTGFYTSDEYPDDVNNTDTGMYFDFYGTGPNLLIIELVTDIPRYLCWAYIVVKFPMLLIEKIYQTAKKRNRESSSHIHLTREEKNLLHSSASHSVERSYVRNLFRGKNRCLRSRLLFGRLMPTFIYQWRDDFRFSSRIFCVYASIFLLLYFITIQSLIRFIPYLNTFEKVIGELMDTIAQIGNSGGINKQFPVPNLTRPFVFAILTAFVITTLQLLILLANIRRNLFKIYRGDD